MKKLGLTVFTALCAICMAFGIMMMSNVKSASAETIVDGAVPVLSETKRALSTDGEGLLIVTAIKNYSDTYEIGYTGLDDATRIGSDSTIRYYTSIKSGTHIWTAKNMFGADYEDAGMIVWEIEYDRTVTYTFQAYATYGQRVDGQLSTYDPERTVYGTQKTSQCTITFEVENGAAISPASVNAGTTVSEWLNSVAVTPDTGYGFVKWQLKTGTDTYVDFDGTETLTKDITVKAVCEIGVGDFGSAWDKTAYVYQTELAAGTIVHVTMDMQLGGSATETNAGGEGYANMLIKSYKEVGTARANAYTTALVSQNDVSGMREGGTAVEFDACVQNDGWICLHLQKMADNSNTAYVINVQDVEITPYDAYISGDFTTEPEGYQWNTPKNIYYTEYTTGTTVHVSMNVWVEGSAVTNNAIDIYSCDRANLSAYVKIVDHETSSNWAGKWTAVEFDAMVQEGGYVVIKLVRITNNYTGFLVKVKDVEVAHAVTFEMGDGTAISPITAAHGATLSTVLSSVSATPPVGYRFVKWQLKTGASTYEDVAAQTVTNNITVKAVYEIITHTVTFEMGDGTAISPITAAHGATLSTVLSGVSVTPPAGYILDKWQLKTGESTYEDVAAQTVTGDITVKAIYAMGVSGDFNDEPSATRWNTPKNIYHTDYVVGATVRVRMNVWLGGSAATNNAMTIWVCDRANLSAYYKLVDASDVSTWANQWKAVEFDAMVQDGGYIVFKLISNSNNNTEYVVKVKDVEVGFGKDLASTGGNQVNTVAQTNYAAGTTVHVSMSVLVDKTEATNIKNLWFGYHNNGNGGYTWITGGSTLVQNIANSGTWQTLEYDTCVQDGGKVCLLAVLNSTSNAGNYFMQVKDVVVTQK